jgi:hypothetical protein
MRDTVPVTIGPDSWPGFAQLAVTDNFLVITMFHVGTTREGLFAALRAQSAIAVPCENGELGLVAFGAAYDCGELEVKARITRMFDCVTRDDLIDAVKAALIMVIGVSLRSAEGWADALGNDLPVELPHAFALLNTRVPAALFAGFASR